MGFVLDEAGNPVIGAIVRLLPANTSDQPVKTLRTGTDGKYLVKNLAPGPYRVRAEARGFLPVARLIEIKPQVILSFDLELRRTDTLAERRQDRDDYRWAVRASRRHVLRFNKNGEMGERVAVGFADGQRRGHVIITSGSLRGDRRRAASGGAMNLALAQELSPRLALAIAAQTMGWRGYPGRWEMEAVAQPFTSHRLNAAIATIEWRAAPEWPHETRRLAFRIADQWDVAPMLSLIYGLDVQRTRAQGLASWETLPRLGLRWAPTEHTRIKADFSSLQEAHTDLTRGSPALPAPYPAWPHLHSDGRPMDGGYHWQVGLERALGEQHKLEIAIFQNASPRDGMLRAMGQAGHGAGVFSAGIESRHGFRLLYSCPIGDSVRATVGYAFGAERSSPSEKTVGALSPRDFHLLAGRVDAILARTRTRVVAHFRAARGWSATDADPFYSLPSHVLSILTALVWEQPSEDGLPHLPSLDPGLTLVIAQELPSVAFLPGRWEAIIEARNLIAWPQNARAEGSGLLLVRAPRSIRGSLALRF
ncbi:hypothetical protein HRbin08_01045 [bacterium HR08]|nr:hypothetical protein HRbin08_01045 [bacterium HR08]